MNRGRYRKMSYSLVFLCMSFNSMRLKFASNGDKLLINDFFFHYIPQRTNADSVLCCEVVKEREIQCLGQVWRLSQACLSGEISAKREWVGNSGCSVIFLELCSQKIKRLHRKFLLQHFCSSHSWWAWADTRMISQVHSLMLCHTDAHINNVCIF